ncbi:hypothetical protein [Pseudomonas taeanensis]|uniref:hypothetical protein n=1 Tax=Pseudomonas taeanensis TaxID=574962 RepID=UPI0009FB913F|nr:hypothetical protein [Pseudomonas taeanensis]
MDDVLVVGVGGAGCDIARHVHALVNGRIVAINTDCKGLENSGITERLLLGPLLCGGNGAFTPNQGMQAAEESREALCSLMQGSRQLVLLAGFGGATGTGAVPVIAQIAIFLGLEVCVAITLPFAFEAARREAALKGLEDLRSLGLSVLVHDHAEAIEVVDRSADFGLIEILETAGKVLAPAVSRQISH